MPEPESTHVRVRLPGGAVKSFPHGHPAIDAEDSQVLDDVDAVDQHGNALPTVYPDPDAPVEAAATGGYTQLTVVALRDEIGRRNEDRNADAQLSTSGNKADLVAELERDDQEKAATQQVRQEHGRLDDQSPEA